LGKVFAGVGSSLCAGIAGGFVKRVALAVGVDGAFIPA
jgi:hypothetical protein